MKVLHLFGDWKWTGPAEPILDLCQTMKARGVDVRLAANPAPPGANTSVEGSARDRGFDLITDFRLGRFPWPSGIRKIRDYIDAEGIDIVHCHMTHDHIHGGPAARRSKRKPKILRTNHRAVPIRVGVGSRFLFGRYTDGYLSYSQQALDFDRRSFDWNGHSWTISPGMKLDRFQPDVPSARADFDIKPDHFVVGVVARMQRHRRFEQLLQGVRLAEVPGLRVLVVGRGTNMEEVAVEPARRMNLNHIVTFTGYVKEKFLNVVAAFDALLFLVPGSDGTCRAVREAMAMGKPVIGARRGMIPELVEDGSSGLIIDDSPENIAKAIRRLAADRELTRDLGGRARERALASFDIRDQAGQIMAIYEEMLKGTSWEIRRKTTGVDGTLAEPRPTSWKMEVPDANITVKGWIVAEPGYHVVIHCPDGKSDRPWGVIAAPEAWLNNAQWFATLDEAMEAGKRDPLKD